MGNNQILVTNKTIKDSEYEAIVNKAFDTEDFEELENYISLGIIDPNNTPAR